MKKAAIISVLKHLLLNDVKIVVAAAYPEGSGIAVGILDEIGGLAEWGKTYGVDYVNLGYIGGLSETTFAVLGADIKRQAPTDMFGTPYEQIPMLENIKDANDFDSVFVTTSGAGQTPLYLVRQWVITYGVHGYMVGGPGASLTWAPYYPDQFEGIIDGPLGSATYEGLLLREYNVPLGEGTRSIGFTCVTVVMLIAFVVIGNIRYFWKKRSKGSEI